MNSVTVALDAMGGDFGPPVTIPAALQALDEDPKLHIQLVGPSDVIQQSLPPNRHRQRLSVLHAPDIVKADDKPSLALRRKQQSSMWIALEQVANQTAGACVSGGNTGALMAIARAQLGMLQGVDRPALVCWLPGPGGHRNWLLDLGANVSCDSYTLFQFALMGSALVEGCEGIERPRIALLNVGSEIVKGNDQVRQAARLLRNCPAVNFTGYGEGHDLYGDRFDVFVADGFVGNVALKTSEGLARLLKQQLESHGGQWRWGWLLKPILRPFLGSALSSLNPDQYNGGSLLGLRGIVVKSHGHAGQAAFVSAIHQAVAEIKRDVPTRIRHRIESVLLERE